MKKSILFIIFLLFIECGKSPEKFIHILKNSPEPEKRYNAAIELGKLKTYKAITPLLESYKIEDNYVRLAILKAIGEIASPETVDFLINEYKNSEDNPIEMRIIALRGLGNIKKNIKSISIIKEAMMDDNFEIREEAIKSYGNAKGEEAVKELIELLDIRQEHEKVIVETLGNIGSKLAVSPLIEKFYKNLQFSESPEFIKYYCEAFVKINDKKFIIPLVKAFFIKNDIASKKWIINSLEKLKIENQYAKVLPTVLHLREKPTIRSKILSNASKNDVLKIISRSKLRFILDNQEDYWYYVEKENGEKGWTFGTNLFIFDIKNEKKNLEE